MELHSLAEFSKPSFIFSDLKIEGKKNFSKILPYRKAPFCKCMGSYWENTRERKHLWSPPFVSTSQHVWCRSSHTKAINYILTTDSPERGLWSLENINLSISVSFYVSVEFRPFRPQKEQRFSSFWNVSEMAIEYTPLPVLSQFVTLKSALKALM